MKELNRLIPLGECGVELLSGQIMSRITIKEDSTEAPVETRRVVVPKCIHSDGSIDPEEMPEEALRIEADLKRLTEVGDIVMKLSTPYDAACINKESAGSIVPSFCAIIKDTGMLDPDYLLAFLNSNACKDQLRQKVAGSSIAMLSVGKIKSVRVPVPDLEKQHEIGKHFLDTQRKLGLVKQIVALEQKKNNIYFRDMVKKYED